MQHQYPDFSGALQIGGNLPHGINSSTSRSVYVGNLHRAVSGINLQDFFRITGPVTGCGIFQRDEHTYGIVDYANHQSAAIAVGILNGRRLFGLPLVVNWPFAIAPWEDTSSYFNIEVNDLSSEITDAVLYAFFSVYESCLKARTMWVQNWPRFGIVSFGSHQDAQRAINELNGTCLRGRRIWCRWDTRGAGPGNYRRHSAGQQVVGPSTGRPSAGHSQQNVIEGDPEDDPHYITIYVVNLPLTITGPELCHIFNRLRVGTIIDVQILPGIGCGFVRYSCQLEAAAAIFKGNSTVVSGITIKCSWSSMPTPRSFFPGPPPPRRVVAAAVERARVQHLFDALLTASGH